MSRAVAAAILVGCLALIAQQTEPPKPSEQPPLAEAKPPVDPPKPVFRYEGKPMAINFGCSEEDMESFGLTCTPEAPCDVYLELSAVEPLAGRLFLSGNLHTTNTTLWSVLLTSEDAGGSWTETYERMRSIGLEQIQFVDFENGWIGGQLLMALPRDPFLLRTTDGGKSWRKQPVTADSRVGSIEQFSFDSKTTGSMVISSSGRYEYYETNTGGDSWSLREAGPRSIRLKRPRIANPDWRVRADAASKSFRVEKRSGNSWQTISAFLVKTGECKPAELKFNEPPPETAAPNAPKVSITDAVEELAPFGRRPPAPKKKAPAKRP